jgi:hypothetical protein
MDYNELPTGVNLQLFFKNYATHVLMAANWMNDVRANVPLNAKIFFINHIHGYDYNTVLGDSWSGFCYYYTNKS